MSNRNYYSEKELTVGLVVKDKKTRVAEYHKKMLKNYVELLGASGLDETKNITRSHIYRRVSLNEMITYEELFPSIDSGSMLEDAGIPTKYKLDFANADKGCWGIKFHRLQ